MNPAGDNQPVPASEPLNKAAEGETAPAPAPRPPLPASSRAANLVSNVQRLVHQRPPAVFPTSAFQMLENPSRTQEQQDAAVETLRRLRLELRMKVTTMTKAQKHLHELIKVIDQVVTSKDQVVPEHAEDQS